MRTTRAAALRPSLEEEAWKRQVQREIEVFLEAISSYPDRVAAEPDLNFEQHISAISSLVFDPPAHSTDRRRLSR